MKNRIPAYVNRIRADQGYQKALMFFFFAAMNHDEFGKWFETVERGPPSRLSEAFRLKMIVRPSARFMRRWFTVEERMGILSSHYAAINNRFSPETFDALFVRPGIQIAELTGKSGKKYPIRINGDVSKDGCIRILIAHPDTDIRLASITGAFGHDEERVRVFWVGSLQGATLQTGKEDVSNATKDLNGLRPKQAVLHATAALARWFGAKQLVAPSIKNQIAIKNFKKGQNIQTEYDSFWADLTNGETNARGDYCLALPLFRRSLEEVQQKRRKDWQLRYARIDVMMDDIKASLNRLAKQK